MKREEWEQHMYEASGPLALERIEELTPEPELLELLRETALPPWPQPAATGRHAEESLRPAMAVLLLGLLRDEGAVHAIIEGLHQAEAEEYDWYREAAVPALAHIGPPASWALREELVRVEHEPDRDPGPPFYYWALVDTYAAIARTHPGEREEFIRFALERITSQEMDPTAPNTTSYSLLWAGVNQGLDFQELHDAVEELFDRLGPGFIDPFLGDRQRYHEHLRSDHRVDYRARLVDWYRELYQHAVERRAGEEIDHEGYTRAFGEGWLDEEEDEQ